MRNVVILGSTGSVGRTALSVVGAFPDRFRVTGLSAHRSVDELARQAREHHVPLVSASDDASLPHLRDLLSGTACRVVPFAEALEKMVAAPETDVVLSAVVGAAGIAPALTALRAGKILAVANKEALVAAGPLLTAAAREHGGRIVPVDSEHSAVFQALRAGRPEEVESIILTASGGPFRTRPLDTFGDITAAEALRHPTWSMGPKITVDSATMMNKALEVIEAVCLFGLPPERIRVALHPQAVVHSMVEFRDGSVIAQMGPPDMRLPVLYALSHPERLAYDGPRLRIADLRSLTFEDVDPRRYPALGLGYRAARERGVAGAVLNAANERSVDAFLSGRIPFPRVTELAAEALDAHPRHADPGLSEVLAADRWARLEVDRCLIRC